MIMIVTFELLLIAVAIYAAICGGSPERWAAALFIGGAALSLGVGRPPDRYQTLDIVQLDIDLVFLGCLVIIMARANRFWPIWLVSLHLMAIGLHLVRVYDETLIAHFYVWAVGKPAWLMCLVLALGTHNVRRRTALDGVAPRDWSRLRM